METAEIATEFDNRAYVPGETLRGTARWEAAAGQGKAVVRLLYHTAGKGTRDVAVIDERVFEGGGGMGKGTFEFALPAGPYSFSGRLVSLIWALELEVEGGPVGRCEFALSPTGREIDLYAHAHAEMPAYSDLGVGLRKGKRKRAGT